MKSIPIEETSTVLAELLKCGYSRTKIKQLLKYRAVEIDEVAVNRLEQSVSPGNIVTIATEKEMAERPVDCPGIKIVYEDEDLLVINKPAGLLTIASASEKNKTAFYKVGACLGARPKGRDRAFVIHRLDQGASGLLVFAKNEEAQHGLQKSWAQAEKQFLIVVEGQLLEKKGKVSNYLCESKIHRMFATTKNNSEGKYAETDFLVVRSSSEFSLVEVSLITSRKNQLRVHLADMGHPVVGDKKYGAKTDPIKRIAMHASLLAFPHPTTGEPMRFTLPMPLKFNVLLKSAQPVSSENDSTNAPKPE
ncbi:MAG: RluA family pseudouridine synthase [Desulfobulbus sp.]|nr:RluA family pseudouridine synthase [Desulfobulbus sp.]